MNIVWKIKNINALSQYVNVEIATSVSTYHIATLPPNHSCLSYINKMTKSLELGIRRRHVEVSQFNNSEINIPFGLVLEDSKFVEPIPKSTDSVLQSKVDIDKEQEEMFSEEQTINNDLITTIKQKIESNFIDYNDLFKKSFVYVKNPKEEYDINFIITARGRKKFVKPMYESFRTALDRIDKKICFTLVEHDVTSKHKQYCKKNRINYIWIKSKPEEMFNKCLCYNMGFLFTNKAKYYLFHDIDILVQYNFFNKIFDNISNQNCKALQCFQKRRVLYCDNKTTAKLIKRLVDVNHLKLDGKNVDLPRLGGKVMLGAPGGSILVDRKLFVKVGGYDDGLFLSYSPEDSFFWEKLSVFTKICLAENPAIDIFHMYHPPSHNSNPQFHAMRKIYEEFKDLPKAEKKEVIKIRKNYFKKFIK